MKLSRRNVLSGVGAAAMLAAIPPIGIGQACVMEGYLRPYGLMGKYVFSKTPFHCHECFRGDETALMLVELKGRVPTTGKVQISGILQAFGNKSSGFAAVLKDAKRVKNTFV